MDADAMLLITEWRQFRYPDFSRMKSMMKQPVIYDGRNQYDPARCGNWASVTMPSGAPDVTRACRPRYGRQIDTV
jgi:hypothetical protein